MTLWNRLYNPIHRVHKGPQNSGYIVQPDGELLLTKYDWSLEFVGSDPSAEEDPPQFTPAQQATIEQMRKQVEMMRNARTS